MKVATASASKTVLSALTLAAASVYVSTGDIRPLMFALGFVILRSAASVMFLVACVCLPADRHEALTNALRCWRRS